MRIKTRSFAEKVGELHIKKSGSLTSDVYVRPLARHGITGITNFSQDELLTDSVISRREG